MTTGMSAPPIGSTKRTPKIAAPAMMNQSSHSCCQPATSAIPAARHAMKSAPFTNCWPTYVIGRPLTSSCSFPNATIEPENETAPMRPESTMARPMSTFGVPGSGRTRCSSASAMSAAAPPPTPLKSATICGIAVIFTRRAATAPKPPPISIASAIAHQSLPPVLTHVTAIAITIPIAPSWLPRRARAGSARNRSARMKVTIVTRYSRFERL